MLDGDGDDANPVLALAVSLRIDGVSAGAGLLAAPAQYGPSILHYCDAVTVLLT